MDVVLDCFLVEEGRNLGGFAGSRNMVKAMLVLRQVPVLDDGSLEGFIDFQGGTLAKDNPSITFEASGKSPNISGLSLLRQPSSQVHSLHLLSMGPSVLNPTKSVSSPPPVNLVQIPQAEALLHADCNGKEVTCEISYYFLQTTEKAAWFITNVQVSGEGPDISMVMKTPRDAENGAVLHPTLNLPLSPRGTVQTTGEKIKSSRKEILGFFK